MSSIDEVRLIGAAKGFLAREGLMEDQQQQDTRKQSHASVLLELARQEVRLYKTPGGEAYADLPIDGRVETHKVKSSAMRDWLYLRFADERGSVPNKTALEQVLGALEAQARFRSQIHDVHVRLASLDNALYLDLHEGMIARVTAEGWEVLPVSAAPVRFRQPRGARPLPVPQRGGSLDELRQFLNLPEGHERDWVLTVAWLLGSFHPTGPYAILALHGEKGSAKSTTTRYLRQLVDPSIAPAPVQPRDGGDLTLKANNNWVVAFDNMSSMPRWLSDGLCRLSTGAGDSKRELYADSEEVIFTAKRPCIINGIEELATAGDLLDRAVIVTLPLIQPERRQSDAGLNERFEEARPRLLGALLDAVVVALGNRQEVQLAEAPRMKDFAEWVVAAEKGGVLGWPEGSFLGAYMGNREDAQRLELEASPVATAVLTLMDWLTEREGKTAWTGTATALREELAVHVDEGATRRYDWPKNGKALSDRLRRDAGALRSVGIEVEWGKSGARSITLSRQEPRPAESVEGTGPSGAEDANIPSSPLSPQSEEKEEGEGDEDKWWRSAPTASNDRPKRHIFDEDDDVTF